MNPTARSTKTPGSCSATPTRLLSDLPQVMKAPERVTQRLNSVGITAILDPKAPPGLLPFYDALDQRGRLTCA